jgi:hypothetical protein
LDVVYNHVNGLDLWQFDGWSIDGICPYCAGHMPNPNHTNGGIYFFEDGRAHTPYSHARFDVGRPEVRQYLLDNAKRWLEDRFLDGLRFDSTVSIRNVQDEFDNYRLEQPVPEGIALLQSLNQHVQSTQGWKIMIAEDLQGDGSITTPVSDGGYGFNAQWDNNFCGKLRWAAPAPQDNQRNIGDLAGAIATMTGGNAFKSILYRENHDQDDPQGSRGRAATLDHRQRHCRHLECKETVDPCGLRRVDRTRNSHALHGPGVPRVQAVPKLRRPTEQLWRSAGRSTGPARIPIAGYGPFIAT